jgi:hypothetical protein
MTEERDPQRVWLVLGLLFDDNTFERSPGFTAETPGPHTTDPESPLRAELFDTEGRLLLRARIPLTRPCTDGPGAAPPFRVAEGTIPFPPATRRVNFLLDDVIVEEYKVPEDEPRTELTNIPQPGARGTVTVAWRSEHDEDIPLTHAVGFSADDGTTWQPLALPTPGDELEVDLDRLPGGERCRVCVKTSDGVHTITAVSKPFSLPEKPCVAMILAPETGLQVDQGATLQLQGQGYWLEEHRAEFENLFWSSSLAGELGQGARIEVDGLEPGRHEITLAAGEGDRIGTSTIEIAVSIRR